MNEQNPITNECKNKYVYNQQYQLMNTFQITSHLEDIYPDVEGELCSKHTVLLNQIQKAYSRAFPMHPPSHYVVSKSILQLIKTHNSTVSMAMEQGTIIMYSKGEEGGELHITGNFINDITLDASGKALNSQNQTELSSILRSIVELATEDLSLNKINGGFFYINCQDNISNRNILKSLLIGFFMGIIAINNLIEEFCEDQLISKLKSSEYLQPQEIESYFSCDKNRVILIKRSDSLKINVPQKYKFVFFSLSLIDESFSFISQGEEYEEIIQKMIQFNDIAAFFSSIQERLSLSLASQSLQKISSIKLEFKIKSFICCQKYAIFLVESHRYAQIIAKMSKFIHKLYNEKSQKQDNGEVTGRFSSSINLNSILFSSVPSKALSILDPTDCIWY